MDSETIRFGLSVDGDTADHSLRLDRSHACAVPWVDAEAARSRLWRCLECGRWWKRTWELAAGQPPVNEDLLLQRAGIGSYEAIELKRLQMVPAEESGLNYVSWTPSGRPRDRGWPLIIFLHGGAEPGGHPSNAARGGLPREIERGFDAPFVVVAPHCPDPPHPNRQSWTEHLVQIAATVDNVRDQMPIDPDAILVTGASMGGHGTWEFAARYPDVVTAAAPVCSGGDPLHAPVLSGVPVCVFHGAVDPIVPVEFSLEMVHAVRAQGGQVRSVIYPGLGHVETATRAYSPGSELYEWFAKVSSERHRRGL